MLGVRIKNVIMQVKIKHTLFLIMGILMLFACKRSVTNNGINLENTLPERSLVHKELLVGSWKDTSGSALHFSLFPDGTARSDNMKTLLYKSWNLKKDKIIFTIESVGNGIRFMDTVSYDIEKVNKNRLVLRNGTSLYEYKKD